VSDGKSKSDRKCTVIRPVVLESVNEQIPCSREVIVGNCEIANSVTCLPCET